MTQDEQKKASAQAALRYIESSVVLGVGTGSTLNALITLMGDQGILPRAAVSSSIASSERLRAIGVEVLDANNAGPIATYIDGADECDPHFRLIKGGGAALTREKILAEASDRFICLIDQSKRVEHLGTFPLPVEVIPMARSLVARKLIGITQAAGGGEPQWRQKPDGQPVVTDNGNWIIDVHGLKILDPVALEREINQVPGVVAVGLFARRAADVVICAGELISRRS